MCAKYLNLLPLISGNRFLTLAFSSTQHIENLLQLPTKGCIFRYPAQVGVMMVKVTAFAVHLGSVCLPML